jgi:hypothetical protein
MRLQADSSKAQQLLGWTPNRISFKTHIELLCKYDFLLEKNETPKFKGIFELEKMTDLRAI